MSDSGRKMSTAFVLAVIKDFNNSRWSMCKSCSDSLEDIDAHCMRCGKKNNKFNKDKFEKEMGINYEIFLSNECNQSGHADLSECSSTHGYNIVYCPHCGAKLEP